MQLVRIEERSRHIARRFRQQNMGRISDVRHSLSTDAAGIRAAARKAISGNHFTRLRAID